MSALDVLIGSPVPEWPRAPGNVRTLLVGGDALMHLREDETRGEVAIYSVPGCLPAQTNWQAPPPGIYRHAGHEQARWVLWEAPAGQRLVLAQIWPRAALDSVTFGQQLSEQARRHRRWRSFCETDALPSHYSTTKHYP